MELPPEHPKSDWGGLMRKPVFWIGMVAMVVAIAFYFSGGEGGSSPTVRVTQSARVSVFLEIKGTGDLTYTNSSGNTEQKSAQSAVGQWATVDSFSTDRGEFLYVSIQNARETGGVECRIRVNGVVIETAKSTGAYVIATCSGAA